MTLVRSQLSQISNRDVPEGLSAELGHLLVRVGLAHKAVAILMPVVRMGEELRQEASTAERLAYALALAKIGSSREAAGLLRSLPTDVPEASLYQGYICQTQWDYTEAVPFIRRYLEIAKGQPYDQAIARVNLLACLIHANDLDGGEKLHAELAAEAKQSNWHLIQKHLMELGAQLAMGRNDWHRAQRIVAEAQGDRQSIETISDLLLAKWSAWIMANNGKLEDGIRSLQKVQQSARTMLHWETIRECDRMLAELTRDHQLFGKVYIGTPYESFRAKLLDRCRSWTDVPQAYIVGDAAAPVLDLQTGHLSGAKEELKAGQVLHRCLSLLFRDFYRPVTVGQLFADLFPNQYFDPNSSVNRVYNVMRRVRNWAKANDLPLTIESDDHAYSVKPWEKGLGVCAQAQSFNADLEIDGRLMKVRSQIRGGPFTSDDVAAALKVSRSSAVRLLNRAVEAGVLSRTGTHRATTYKWVA